MTGTKKQELSAKAIAEIDSDFAFYAMPKSSNLDRDQKKLMHNINCELNDISRMADEFERARNLSNWDDPFRPKAVNDIYKREMHSIAFAIADATRRAIDSTKLHINSEPYQELLDNGDNLVSTLTALSEALLDLMWD